MDPVTATTATSILPLIFQAAIGPGGAVVILLIILGFIGYIIVKHAMPALDRIFIQHKEDITQIMNSHKEDREIFKSTVDKLGDGITKIEFRLGTMEKAIDRIGDEIDDIRPKRRASSKEE